MGKKIQNKRTGQKEYFVWKAMKARCFNPRNKFFKDYGARGITVCKRWLDYSLFIWDLGKCPDGWQIERVDNNGNYDPQNCRWATIAEQKRNTRQTRFLELNGERLCMRDWSNRMGFSKTTIHYRLLRGWSVEKAITTPLRQG